MTYWRDQGTPLEKLRMGFAVYGRTFRLTSPDNGVGAPVGGAASAGTYTREAGFWAYYEVNFRRQMSMKMTFRCSGTLNIVGVVE